MNLTPTPVLQDCWNRIGVQGDVTCPRLAEVSHCRNCPVYSATAAHLLHDEPPAEYLREWTDRLARPLPAVATARTRAVMIFRIEAEWLALPAAVFQEVAEPRPMHSLPHRRGKILKGLVNIRGELVLCVSLGGTLGIEDQAVTGRNGRRQTTYERLLVAGTPGGRLAFPVSEVHGIESFAPTDLRAVPETLALAAARYTAAILSWRGRTVGCLDDQPLFDTINRSLG